MNPFDRDEETIWNAIKRARALARGISSESAVSAEELAAWPVLVSSEQAEELDAWFRA